MCHVLIIEDSPFIAKCIEHLFRDAGATSTVIVDSELDAVAADIDRRPEIILSDVKLRNGLNPLAAEMIHVILGPVRVIFLTSDPADCQSGEPLFVILAKPVAACAFTDAFKRVAASLNFAPAAAEDRGILASDTRRLTHAL